MTKSLDIQPDEWPLIQAAIGLGDWLAAQPEMTDDQRAAIRAVQHALGKLPDITWELNACYGFAVTDRMLREWNERGRSGPCPPALWRFWSVEYYERESTDGSPEATLEIFYLHSPYPARLDDQIAGSEFELDVEIRSGQARSGLYEPGSAYTLWQAERMQAWIEATRDPARYRTPATHFEIEAERWTPN